MTRESIFLAFLLLDLVGHYYPGFVLFSEGILVCCRNVTPFKCSTRSCALVLSCAALERLSLLLSLLLPDAKQDEYIRAFDC